MFFEIKNEISKKKSSKKKNNKKIIMVKFYYFFTGSIFGLTRLQLDLQNLAENFDKIPNPGPMLMSNLQKKIP